MVRAVHRLEQVFFALLRSGDRTEGIAAVVLPVAGSHIKLLVAYVRGDHRKVTVFLLDFPEEELQAETQVRSLRKPQRKSGSHFRGESKELHFLAYLAMVTLLGLLKHSEVLVQHRLLRKTDTVDAGEHVTLLIASPVGSCYGKQLDGFYYGSVLQMRTTAQVGEISILIESDGAVLEFPYKLALVLIALLGEIPERILLADLGTHEDLLPAGQFQHLVLDGLQFRLGELVSAEIDIIIEAVFDCRADSELDARIKGLESLGHKM